MQKEFIEIKQLYRNKEQYIDKTVKVAGWIRTSKNVLKTFGFIELNDGSFFKNMQIVIDEKLENFKEIGKLPISTSLLIEGTLVATQNAKQPVEIQATRNSSRR